MSAKTIIISLFLMPITGLADSTVFSTGSGTYPGSGKAGLGQSQNNLMKVYRRLISENVTSCSLMPVIYITPPNGYKFVVY